MKLYIAGPDIFRPDVLEWAEFARETCRRHGYDALIPLDHDETEAPRIFQANLELIHKAQIVVANLNPFRGAEPDSGTCFEMGYALALNRKVCGYVERKETLLARVNRLEGSDPAGFRDKQGMAIENFGLPLNLMLSVPALIVVGGLEECLRQLRGGGLQATTPGASLPDNSSARKAIEAAIRYLRWAEEGRIADVNAIATIADQYKVGDEIVRSWIDAWSDVFVASHEDYRTDDIVRQMMISGRQFRNLK